MIYTGGSQRKIVLKMKQTRTIVLTAILTLMIFGGISYTSCKKDPCKKTTCFNGGVCENGTCLCKDGYTGLSCEIKNKSTIRYYNTTSTPLAMTVGGVLQILDTGAFLDYTREIGDSIKGTAKTQNFNLYPIYGVQVEWPLRYVFPARGVDTIRIRVPKNYFFVKAVNNSTVPNIKKVVVNYNKSDSAIDITPIYNTGKPFFIGYYPYRDSSCVRLEEFPNQWKFPALGFIDTQTNKVFTAIAN
jgi:hypothetical protein